MTWWHGDNTRWWHAISWDGCSAPDVKASDWSHAPGLTLPSIMLVSSILIPITIVIIADIITIITATVITFHHSDHYHDDDDTGDSLCRPPHLPVVPILATLVPLSSGALTSTHYVIIQMMMMMMMIDWSHRHHQFCNDSHSTFKTGSTLF